VIVRMVRVRIAGPRSRLDRTLTFLQDLGVLHIVRARVPADRGSSRILARERRHIERCLHDVESALQALRLPIDTSGDASPPESAAHAVRHARYVRRCATGLAEREIEHEEERNLLLRYREFFNAFEPLVAQERTWPEGQAFYIILRAGSTAALTELRQRLNTALSGEVELFHRDLASGEHAVLILVSARVAPKVSALLTASRVEELPTPANIGDKNLLRALPAIDARIAAIRFSLQAIAADRAALARTEGAWLSGLRRFLHDQLLLLDARACIFAAEHLFIIEGWVPAPRFADVQARVPAMLGPEIVVSTTGTEEWADDGAPVALHNPAVLQPFEVLTRMVPLPKYGTIDPTPFVAVFFPAFFGLMLGDVGYGLMLVLVAALLRWKSDAGTTLRSVSMVALACSSSAIIFGFVFGEFFGSLGPVIGLRPFFDREQSAIPFLVLTVALGVVHVILGLVLAGVSAWRRGHRREAMGRSVALGMVLLTTMLLLVALEIWPAGLRTPLVVALLVSFTVLVALEGLMAVIELLSTVGHVLSYARIMALGTASLMLAIVANQMAGALGSAVVGAIFALLFHLVNFAIGLFSPTIHALRLHYVEFFGRFFSPGGAEYRPFRHWHPSG
jgi:V/A-type H+/Na+-transporting ATPase subunit I